MAVEEYISRDLIGDWALLKVDPEVCHCAFSEERSQKCWEHQPARRNHFCAECEERLGVRRSLEMLMWWVDGDGWRADGEGQAALQVQFLSFHLWRATRTATCVRRGIGHDRARCFTFNPWIFSAILANLPTCLNRHCVFPYLHLNSSSTVNSVLQLLNLQARILVCFSRGFKKSISN